MSPAETGEGVLVPVIRPEYLFFRSRELYEVLSFGKNNTSKIRKFLKKVLTGRTVSVIVTV